MALIGLSIIVASLLFVAIRPQPRLIEILVGICAWPRRLLGPLENPLENALENAPTEKAPAPPPRDAGIGQESTMKTAPAPQIHVEPLEPDTSEDQNKAARDRMAMPPPPPRLAAAQQDPSTTPKARASRPSSSVPSLSLSSDSSSSFPAPDSAQRARPSPLPQRGPFSSSSSRSSSRSSSSFSLSPPPTHAAPPTKPSRAVVLTPGHSPLDWARLSSDPTADLRGLGPDAPPALLRVTPTMLRRHSGRKGNDAWMSIGGRVYNVTPYLDFHPGGRAELLRGAARDATRLFGEVHPWVNYETMLSACLVGIAVDEEEARGGSMDEMD